MKKRMYKFMRSVIALLLVVSMAIPTIVGKAETASQGIAILYTNDVHCAIDNYAKIAAYGKVLEEEGYEVITVDVGDAIQGEIIGSLTKGSAIIDLMNLAGYDYAVPGNHEFDYGMETFLNLAKNEAEFSYLCANFMDLTNQKTVFNPYQVITVGQEKIALVGITTPETYGKSSPAYFQDENGNYIYSFAEDAFYQTIQNSIDAAKTEGADTIIALGHLGIQSITEGWRSTDVIANTTGIDVFLDGHSHETIEAATYPNREGEDVLLSSTGTKFTNFGQLLIHTDGTVDTTLVEPETIFYEELSTDAKASYDKVQDSLDAYKEELAYLYEELGTSETELVVYKEDGTWQVRSAETNTGDFVADAYRSILGTDIAVANGGGIRAGLDVGTVTRKELMDINPWNNEMCKLKVTGQQVLDLLEYSVREYPVASGGFLQVSGITFDVHAWKESPVVVDDKENFVKMDETKERRIANVKVNGVTLDPAKTYTIGGSQYVLMSGGDGNTVLSGAEVIATEGLLPDAEILVKYFEETLGGKITKAQYGNPKGEGRIVIYDTKPAETIKDIPKDSVSKNEEGKTSAPKKNTILKHKKSKGKYKVTKAGVTGGTVSYAGPTKKNIKKVTIPAKITVDGISYQVTGIEKKAFYGCKKVKKIIVKTKKLTAKKVGKKAFANMNKKVTIKVPKGKVRAYKKIFRKKGLSKKAKIK